MIRTKFGFMLELDLGQGEPLNPICDLMVFEKTESFHSHNTVEHAVLAHGGPCDVVLLKTDGSTRVVHTLSQAGDFVSIPRSTPHRMEPSATSMFMILYEVI